MSDKVTDSKEERGKRSNVMERVVEAKEQRQKRKEERGKSERIRQSANKTCSLHTAKEQRGRV